MTASDGAALLASRPYRVIAFRTRTTDGEPIYIAVNPELEGCHAQGNTLEEAKAHLDEFRVDYIRHLMEHGIAVPDPVPVATGETVRIDSPA